MPGTIDFKAFERPSSPNTALLAPAGFTPTATPDGAAPIYNASPKELYKRLLGAVAAKTSWELTEQDADGLRVRFIAVSALMRFKDDVDVVVLPVAGQPDKSTFAAYSRSRVGYSDLGANRKRLDALSGALMAP